MAIALRYAARSDIGLGRYRNNQDSAYAGPHLLVVADGMGGHAGGDVASSVAVGELAALDGESHGPDAVQHLETAVRRAHDVLQRSVADQPTLAGMGTTVTAILRSGRRLVLAHIGDSRGYLLHDGELTQVTRDHSFVQRLVDEGRITPEEAEHHPQRSVILRVLSDADPEPELDVSVREAEVGDRWMLCSDGLSDVVSADTLAETLRSQSDPAACAEALVDLALRGGGQDNVSCVVADVVEVDEIPPTSPQVVGSAAVDRSQRSSGQGSPASRGAALAAASTGDTDDDTHDDTRTGSVEEIAGRGTDGTSPGTGRTVGRVVAAAGVVALLVGGAWAAFAWSQQQFFIGPDGGDVAIYRGLPQDVGPISLSSVYEQEDLPLEALPAVWRARVDERITADDLPHARRIVGDLLQRSELCERPAAASPAPTTPAPKGTTPAPTPAPSGTAAPTPTPTPTNTPTPTPTPSLPDGCEEAR